MNQSKISSLFKLSNLIIFLTAISLHINIFMPEHKILYLIPLLSIILFFNKKNKFSILLPILLSILSIFLLFYYNEPFTFINFLENISFIFLYILFLNFFEKNFSNYISIPILIFYLIIYEKFLGINFYLTIGSTFLIVITIFLKFLIYKGFYFWENDFSIKGDPYKRSFKYLLLSFIFFPIFYFFTFMNFPDLKKLFIFNTNTNKITEKIEEKAPETSLTTISRYIFTIKIGTEKIINFLLNSFYLIIFLGFLIFFVFIGIILYRLIRNVYGKSKAIRFLLLSFSLSVILLSSTYFLYKPFERFIFYLRDKLNIGETLITPFKGISNLISRFLPKLTSTHISNISIDIGVVLIVIMFILLTSISLYFIIFFLFKQAFDNRKIELSKIIDNLKTDEINLYEIKGSNKEKIILLYNNLIKKLSIIIKKFIHETPLEYNFRFKQEKPNLGYEFELITDNFIIAKYSNIDIEDEIFNETLINYQKIIEKLFKEVHFGGKI